MERSHAAVRFTRHALEKMYERGISPEACETVARDGTIVERYPEDTPFPSELRMGRAGDRVRHVVVSCGEGAIHVITAYEPNPARWDATFTKRRPSR